MSERADGSEDIFQTQSDGAAGAVAAVAATAPLGATERFDARLEVTAAAEAEASLPRPARHESAPAKAERRTSYENELIIQSINHLREVTVAGFVSAENRVDEKFARVDDKFASAEKRADDRYTNVDWKINTIFGLFGTVAATVLGGIALENWKKPETPAVVAVAAPKGWFR